MLSEIDEARFRDTLGHYPTGVAVVTAVAENGSPVGMVVGTFSSVSLAPPLIAFFPMRGSRTFAQIRTASAFCVNVLASDQESLCRRLAMRGTNKMQGVTWRPGVLGSPILDGAVSWLECTFEEVRDAGDHEIVLGRVCEFGTERPTLPLLFFQGGYGRFSPGSLLAAPDSELIQAAQIAESIRPAVEALAAELSVNCSVHAKIRWDGVEVMSANHANAADVPLGLRRPMVPPLGAIFLMDAAEPEVDAWLKRAPDDSEKRRQRNRALLDDVRERGYSVLAAEPEALERQQASLSAFEMSDRLPRQEQALREVTAELRVLDRSELSQGRTYGIASIIVPLPTSSHLLPMALGITGLSRALSIAQVESLVFRLGQIANTARP